MDHVHHWEITVDHQSITAPWSRTSPVTVCSVGAVLEFGILGPLEVRIDGEGPVNLGGTRQRALLAVLLLHANEVVSTDRLVDELWGEEPPATAVHTIRVFVSRLRSALASASDRLATQSPGYAIHVGVDEVDAARFEQLCATARRSFAAGNAADAVSLLSEALTLWRGPPLTEFTYERFAQAEIARLGELRVSAREELTEAELALGRHEQVIAALEGLICEQPFRERPRRQLMLALYRCGRQADALEAFQAARRALVDELGVEPGDALRELEQSILRQDPSLAAPPPPGATTSPAPAVAVSEPQATTPPPEPSSAVSSPDSSFAATLRKTATILVVRLATIEPSDPEVARAVIARAREDVERIISRHGGMFISGLGGDVVGLFGLPLTREDDALRALRASQELREQLPTPGAGEPRKVAFRIGLDTGDVVADAPDDVFGEPLGGAVALALVAGDGEILLSDSTRRLASDAIRIESALDGAAWLLLDLITRTRGIPRRMRPMVDRHAELQAMHRVFTDTIKSGNARMFAAIGEPGIGKSRLAQELVDRLAGQATILTGHCLSYGEGIAFWPLREAVTQLAGDDSRDAIRALMGDASEADLTADIVARTLGLAEAESPHELAPWAFRRLLEVLASHRPVVLVIEDAHWAERPLFDVIDYLIDWLTAPVLVLCTGRPELLEAQREWGGGRPRVESCVLAPLSRQDATELLDQQLDERHLSDGERTQIVETAEGNPLFVEQLLAMRAEDPAWNREREIPATIRNLLAARLDRLGPGERAFIERAAVIGREFWPGAVLELLPDEARASAGEHLRALVHRGLIHPDRSTLAGEEQLRFEHMLIRDVAYNSAPKALRAELHERFADWLAARGEGYEEFVGYHLQEAFLLHRELAPADRALVTLAARAGESLAAAGRRALARGDTNAGVKLLGSARTVFDATGRARADVLLDLGSALGESGEYADAMRILRDAGEQALATEADAVGARASIELSYIRGLVDPAARVEETKAVAEASMEVFKHLGDEGGLARALLHIADVHWTRCCLGDMEQVLERALEHADRAGAKRERSHILGDLARTAVMGPRPVDDAIRRCNDILERAGEDVILTALTDTMLAVLEGMCGQFAEARERWRRSKLRLEDFGLYVTASQFEMYSAFIELMAETPGNAEPGLTDAYTLLERCGERSRLATVAALLGRVLCAQHRYEEAERYCQISEEASSSDDVVTQVLWRATRARVLAHEGAGPLADELAGAAVTLAQETDFLMLHADAVRDRAAVRTSLGRLDAAARGFDAAIALYERKGMRGSAEAARRARDLLTARQGAAVAGSAELP